jgi:hypothetical protein
LTELGISPEFLTYVETEHPAPKQWLMIYRKVAPGQDEPEQPEEEEKPHCPHCGVEWEIDDSKCWNRDCPTNTTFAVKVEHKLDPKWKKEFME